MTVLRYVDLFSGIGGFRCGADLAQNENVKLDCVGGAELDPQCIRVYERAFETSQLETFVPDVANIGPPGSRSGTPLPDFDLMFAGFPCQSFANIGGRAGLADERGQLFHQVVRLLRLYQPPAFVLENVAKLQVLDKGAVLEQMVAVLCGRGYRVRTLVLDATDFGLPQQRRRLFFVGVRRDICAPARLQAATPMTTSLQSTDTPTAWHMLDKEMPLCHLIPARTRATVLRRNHNWQGRLSVNPKLARPITASMGKWHRANQDNYFTEEYVHTGNSSLEDLPVEGVTGPVRRITPTEALRLQGFGSQHVDAFSDLTLPPTTAYRLAGNAVPTVMAQAGIEMAMSCLD